MGTPHANRLGMGAKAFGFGEGSDHGRKLAQSFYIEVLYGDDLYEVVDAQATAKPRRSRRGQNVIGAGRIISSRLRRVVANEDRRGITYLGKIASINREVLRSDPIDPLHCLFA